jgi:uncharacterized protein
MGQHIAIVGSGISGLGAAWALANKHTVTLFEADDRLGGHAHTVDVPTSDGAVAVDTGFIVYNEVTYPNLTRLFAALDVPTEPSDMSFAFSLDRSLEYAGSVRGMLAQPANLAKPRFRRMLADINRFRREGGGYAVGDEPIGAFLERLGYSPGFTEDYLLPMAGAIWSARQDTMREFPAASLLRFLGNHGLIDIVGRPRWRTVTGGSRSYVQRLAAELTGRIRLATPVQRVVRTGGQVLLETREGVETFDHVVLATHSDQALAILGDDATERERTLLEAITYEPNEAILHSDPDLMPRNRRLWSSWNAMTVTEDRRSRAASVTYWMNRLQSLRSAPPLFVSLNPLVEPRPDLVHGRYSYAHPQFDARAMAAQRRLAEVQGRANTWFAGAYLGYGFHEDGLQAGLAVAAALGSPAPWHGELTPVSSTPLLDTARAA